VIRQYINVGSHPIGIDKTVQSVSYSEAAPPAHLSSLVKALRLHDAIESIKNYESAQSHCLSASIGICLLPYVGNTVDDIISRADTAMYKAKKIGSCRYALTSKATRSPAELFSADKRE
jgi:GGDEF domain-containing protein